MIVHIVRALYLVVVLAYTVTYAFRYKVYAMAGEQALNYVTLYILVPALAALALILVDMFWRRKHLQVLSGLFFGVIAGLLIAYAAGKVVDMTGVVFGTSPVYTQAGDEEQSPGRKGPEDRQIKELRDRIEELRKEIDAMKKAPGLSIRPAEHTRAASPDKIGRPGGRSGHRGMDRTVTDETVAASDENPVSELVKVLLGVSAVFLCVTFVLQTKDDFRFIIPYVEFAKQTKGVRPLLLDSSAIIDGRVADVSETGVLESELIVPRFVLAEVQAIADSDDKLKRNRGRRGLDVLNRLKSSEKVDIRILEPHLTAIDRIEQVDEKLVALAKHLDGRVMTNDYNLNKIARLRGVEVININDLANALKVTVLPGEKLKLKVIKPGEEPGQGVGYLPDGTMVVVEGGKDHIGQDVTISVTSALQTSAGRMVFGRLEVADAP